MGTRTPPCLHHVGPIMTARAWPRPSPRQLEDLRRPSASYRCFSFVSSALWWMYGWIIPPWAPKGLYLCPWGALGCTPPCPAWDLPWERRELSFHKISLVQIFLIRSPSLLAPYLPRLDSKKCKFGVLVVYGTKFPPTLVFIAFLGNEDKIFKSALKDNVSDFGLVCAVGISGSYLLALDPNWVFQMSKSKVSSRPTTLVVKLLPLEVI
jgi:hypothetical protein